MSSATVARLEHWLVLLIVAHSAGVGALLLFVPSWALGFAGWSAGGGDLFFPRQAGVFHFVVAFGYFHEYLRHRGVTLLVVTKTAAFLFLTAMALGGELAWAVTVSGVADGLMGLAVALVHRATPASEPARSPTP